MAGFVMDKPPKWNQTGKADACRLALSSRAEVIFGRGDHRD
jgi:hypothetical protein